PMPPDQLFWGYAFNGGFDSALCAAAIGPADGLPFAYTTDDPSGNNKPPLPPFPPPASFAPPPNPPPLRDTNTSFRFPPPWGQFLLGRWIGALYCLLGRPAAPNALDSSRWGNRRYRLLDGKV